MSTSTKIQGTYREVVPKKDRELWVVKWFDANHGDYTTRGRAEPDSIELVTCGFFVSQDDQYVSLSREEKADEESWRGIMNIPKVNIISIKKGKIRA